MHSSSVLLVFTSHGFTFSAIFKCQKTLVNGFWWPSKCVLKQSLIFIKTNEIVWKKFLKVSVVINFKYFLMSKRHFLPCSMVPKTIFFSIFHILNPDKQSYQDGFRKKNSDVIPVTPGQWPLNILFLTFLPRFV